MLYLIKNNIQMSYIYYHIKILGKVGQANENLNYLLLIWAY